jgi:hypothetical protein
VTTNINDSNTNINDSIDDDEHEKMEEKMEDNQVDNENIIKIDDESDILITDFWLALMRILNIKIIPQPDLDEDTTINIAQFMKPKKKIGLRFQKTGSPMPILYHGRGSKTENKERPASNRDGGNSGTGS